MATRVVVAGGGTAGCIVATRLSEDPGNQVTLLEAGPDYPDVHAAPEDIRSGFLFGGTGHDWGYEAEAGGRPDPSSRVADVEPIAIPALRGKVMGGSSSVNGTSILRAHPADFAAWVAAGNPRWAWDEVLPAFCRVEDDAAPGPWHGRGGPLHVHRFTGTDMRPVHRAFLDACIERGHPMVDDHNAPDAVGGGPIPVNQVDGVRQSAAVTYLAKARARANLVVRSGVMIDRLEIVDGTPTAVVLADGERVEGDVFVVSAGVYGSPAILLRSGIGPSGHLEALGIAPAADLPAVGNNLRDHPNFVLAVDGNIEAMGALDPPIQTTLTLTTDGSGDPAHIDIQVALAVTTPGTTEWFQSEPGTLLFGVALVKPRSVGCIELASRRPEDPPRIWFNFFDDPSDTDRLVAGVRATRDLIRSRSMATFAGAERFPGVEIDDDALRDVVRTSSLSYAHGTGTCRMGPNPRTAVVDETGHVHGFDNLLVIDASIMPALPSVPTNSTTMMLAERCAGWLCDELRGDEPQGDEPQGGAR